MKLSPSYTFQQPSFSKKSQREGGIRLESTAFLDYPQAVEKIQTLVQAEIENLTSKANSPFCPYVPFYTYIDAQGKKNLLVNGNWDLYQNYPELRTLSQTTDTYISNFLKQRNIRHTVTEEVYTGSMKAFSA